MSHHSEYLDALARMDVKAFRKMVAILFPHIPPAGTDADLEAMMHMARTQMSEMAFKDAAWSHRWLTERGLPSQLPDELRPKAERMYPIIVEAVLVSANSASMDMKPVAALIQKAMSDAVEDCFANGDRNPELVKARMQEARGQTIRSLLGTTGVR